MDGDIPRQIMYSYVKPKGFASQFTQWVINPMGQQNVFSPDEILRYQMNLNTGYFDPYRSYFDIVVQTDIPCGAMQMDFSGFSFISQSLVTGIMNAQELQRIPQYDQIGAMTVQLGYQPVFAAGKQYMGLGASFFTNCAKAPVSAVSSTTNTLMQNWTAQKAQIMISDYGSNTFNPVFINNRQTTVGSGDLGSHLVQKPGQNKVKSGVLSKYKQDLEFNPNTLPYMSPNTLGNSPSFLSQINMGLFDNWTKGAISTDNKNFFCGRTQYTLSTLNTKYVDSSSSLVRNGIMPINMITQFQPNNPYVKYQLQPPQKLDIRYYDLSSTVQPTPYYKGQVMNQCGLHGFLNPYSPQLSVGLDQPFISPTILQCGMKNGKIIPKWLPVYQKRIVVPFLSSIMGALIPQTSYSLLPVQAFRVYLQLTLNKFAMFSSGFNDRTPFDSSGMQYPIQRRFYFRKFNYVLQLYYFQQPSMKSYLQRSLIQGFVFNTQPMMLTSNYVIQNQLSLRGSWTINTPATFLSQLIVRFLDTRYLKYPFLRKQYALSCNITSFQIKFDTKWYPPQPIVGNAGNPQYLDSTGNVQPYIQMLFKTKDSLFSRSPAGITNAVNFAINSRIFQPSRVQPLMGKPLNGDQYKNFVITDQNQMNTHTAMGFPFFHQNRACGRALYVYNFQSMGHSKGMANGLQVGNSRPFQLILNTSVQQPFNSQIAMYIFTRSHQTVSVSKKGVYVTDYS